jgi:hypothetical protein
MDQVRRQIAHRATIVQSRKRMKKGFRACCMRTGAKLHIVYDPHADVTPARLNRVTAAQALPIARGAT